MCIFVKFISHFQPCGKFGFGVCRVQRKVADVVVLTCLQAPTSWTLRLPLFRGIHWLSDGDNAFTWHQGLFDS